MRVELDGGYVITDDPAVVDRDRLFVWLRDDAYWWEGGLHRDVFEQAIDNSLAASALGPNAEFVGFARLVTDRASFAYLCDVYVDPAHRGRGLGGQLTAFAVEHPALATCRRVMLATRDAHEVYARRGFAALPNPAIFMQIDRPDAARDGFTTP